MASEFNKPSNSRARVAVIETTVVDEFGNSPEVVGKISGSDGSFERVDWNDQVVGEGIDDNRGKLRRVGRSFDCFIEDREIPNIVPNVGSLKEADSLVVGAMTERISRKLEIFGATGTGPDFESWGDLGV